MRRSRFPSGALSLVGVLALVAAAIDAAPARQPPAFIPAATITRGDTIELTLPWRFHPGDDSRWADPSFDDGSWEDVGPALGPSALPRGGWPGIGWFRRHFSIEESLDGEPLVMRIATRGRARLYLDGREILSTTTAAASPVGGGASSRGAWVTVRLDARREHVLAVRFEWAWPGGIPPEGIGFRLSVEQPDATARSASRDRLVTGMAAVFTTIPALLALLHLALFWSYPRARENLFAALCMASMALIVVGNFESTQQNPTLTQRVLADFGAAAVIAAIFFGLMTFYTLRTVRLPQTWIGFAVVGGILFFAELFIAHAAPFQWKGQIVAWCWYLYFAASIVEIIRVEASGAVTKREGDRILLMGMLVLDVVIVVQVLANIGVISPIAGVANIYLVGILALAVSMSLALARNFARTSINLERRLEDVRALSEQVLAGEREAHERDLERQRLEIENERKTTEIEAARSLQLSMLPTKLPAVAGLEIAASMTTATEVGGDYYDFRVEPDGSLVIAIGDATGHGVAAGTMVTAVKALFSALVGGEDLGAILEECDRVLRDMNVRPMHMCLTLARATPRSVTVASAAMPPLLVHRAATKNVEEVGTGALPLGVHHGPRRKELRTALEPGDTLLFATDGLAEQTNDEGEVFGYGPASAAFGEAAGEPAAEVIGRMKGRLAAWRGRAEQDDDTTMVVVRVTA